MNQPLLSVTLRHVLDLFYGVELKLPVVPRTAELLRVHRTLLPEHVVDHARQRGHLVKDGREVDFIEFEVDFVTHTVNEDRTCEINLTVEFNGDTSFS